MNKTHAVAMPELVADAPPAEAFARRTLFMPGACGMLRSSGTSVFSPGSRTIFRGGAAPPPPLAPAAPAVPLLLLYRATPLDGAAVPRSPAGPTRTSPHCCQRHVHLDAQMLTFSRSPRSRCSRTNATGFYDMQSCWSSTDLYRCCVRPADLVRLLAFPES